MIQNTYCRLLLSWGWWRWRQGRSNIKIKGHYLHYLYLVPFPHTITLSPVSKCPRHQQPSTAQNGVCKRKRLEEACLERRDFNQDNLSTTNLLAFWSNKCSEHRSIIFKRHWCFIPLSERIWNTSTWEKHQQLRILLFLSLPPQNFNTSLMKKRKGKRRNSFSYPNQQIYFKYNLLEDILPSENVSMTSMAKMKVFFFFFFCLHPSWMFLAAVKIKPIIKTRCCDILEIQAPGKLKFVKVRNVKLYHDALVLFGFIICLPLRPTFIRQDRKQALFILYAQ